MSKKWLCALGAFALGVGAGLGLNALWQKCRCSTENTEDGIADPVPAIPDDSACACTAQEEQKEVQVLAEGEEEHHSRLIREVLEGVGEELTLSCSSNAYHIRHVLTFRPASAVHEAVNYVADIALLLGKPVRSEISAEKPGTLVLETAKQTRCTLRYGEMTDASEQPMEVPIGIQLPYDGTGSEQVVYCDLPKMPHLLLAGTTGSGKTVAENVLLTGLVEKNYPEQLRLVLVDPKQIEFSAYEDLPHLLAPIVTSPCDALATFMALVQEMEHRFALMKNAGVRDLIRYNEKTADTPEKNMPYIVVAVDELADLAASEYGEQIETFLVRLAQKGRPAGIHLILGTLRLTSDVLTDRLKASIPSRMAFAARDTEGSRVILDMDGAETLRGYGDMLYMSLADKLPRRVQCAYLSDGEMEERFAALRRALPPLTYDEDFSAVVAEQISILRDSAVETADARKGKEDPLFEDALRLFLNAGKVATSLLQRRLSIGYVRATRILDGMELLGLISHAEGNKPRKLLPAAEEYLENIENGEV